MSHEDLIQYYLCRGLMPGQFWIGPEHPALEELALELLYTRESKSVLEIGYQAGGFAVPLIRALHDMAGFHYTGIDNLTYQNSVSANLISAFVIGQGVPADRFRFLVADASDFLAGCDRKFDLILIDHKKDFYARDLRTILARGLLGEDGVVLLHDVLQEAAKAWGLCSRVCTLFGYSWELHREIPAGVAVVRRGTQSPARRLLARLCSIGGLTGI